MATRKKQGRKLDMEKCTRVAGLIESAGRIHFRELQRQYKAVYGKSISAGAVKNYTRYLASRGKIRRHDVGVKTTPGTSTTMKRKPQYSEFIWKGKD